MQNININTITNYMSKETAVNFLENLLHEDIKRTEGRPIEAYKANDTFFTIEELMRILCYSDFDFDKFTLEDAVYLLHTREKAELFDLIVNNDDNLPDVIQDLCKDNVLNNYNFKIELYTRLRKVSDLKSAIEKYITKRY